MEENQRVSKSSSDSIATSEEFEDLGQPASMSATKNTDTQSVNNQPVAELPSDSKPSPEMEIGNGNIGDLQDTLNEALNEENLSNGND